MNKKILALGLVGMFLLTSIAGAISTTQQNTDEWDIIVDDDGTGDYTSIQEAIDNAWPGASIYVMSGDYEDFDVGIPGLTIHGEDKTNTRIIADYLSTCVWLKESADYTSIIEFTIMHGFYGIWCQSDYNVISRNIITDIDGVGISIEDGHHNQIIGNIITDGTSSYFVTGISIYRANASNNEIKDNIISDYYCGINIFWHADKNQIIRNTIENNRYSGIEIFVDSFGNELYHNVLRNNKNFNAWDDGDNIWDDGQGKGNYWDDYKGFDLNFDGIGDIPYTILDSGFDPTNNEKDRWPLMTPNPNFKSRTRETPRGRTVTNPILLRLIEQFPIIIQLLQKVFQ